MSASEVPGRAKVCSKDGTRMTKENDASRASRGRAGDEGRYGEEQRQEPTQRAMTEKQGPKETTAGASGTTSGIFLTLARLDAPTRLLCTLLLLMLRRDDGTGGVWSRGREVPVLGSDREEDRRGPGGCMYHGRSDMLPAVHGGIPGRGSLADESGRPQTFECGPVAHQGGK